MKLTQVPVQAELYQKGGVWKNNPPRIKRRLYGNGKFFLTLVLSFKELSRDHASL
jgi:hypothetical protein